MNNVQENMISKILEASKTIEQYKNSQNGFVVLSENLILDLASKLNITRKEAIKLIEKTINKH